MIGGPAKEPRRPRKTVLVLAAIIVVVIVVIAALTPFMGAGGSADREEMARTTWSVIIGSTVQANITVVGGSPDTPLIVDVLRTRALSVTTTNDTDEMNRSNGLICIDCSGLSEQTLGEYTEPLQKLLQNGTPLILINDTEGILDHLVVGQNISHIAAVSTDGSPIAVRALKHDPLGGNSGSLDLGGRADDRAQLAKALSNAYNWSADRLLNGNASGIVWDDRQIYEAFSYSYYSGDLFEPYGRFAIANSYIRTIWNTTLYPSNEEWYVHYRAETDPGYGVYNNEFSTKSMTISASFADEAKMHRYYPSTAYGVDSVGIYLSKNANDYLGHWDYRIKDVVVLDHSNFGVNKVSLYHELDASNVVSKTPYIAEPGAGFSIARNAGFSFQEDYVLDWQRPSLFIWEGHTANLTVSGTIVG